MSQAALLEVRSLCKDFGGLEAVKDVSFAVAEGQIKALIGPNGAGKTTIFNLLTGVLPAQSGSAQFAGRSVLGAPPHRITALGVGRTFQTTLLFDEMTVLENVMVGYHLRGETGMLASALRTFGVAAEETQTREAATGKSTILKTISGLVRADTGSISFDDQETSAWGPVQIVRAGLCQVPEGRQLFGTLSVADNLMLGAYVRRARSSKREIVADIEEQYERFPLLADRHNQHAGSLSGGEQQMLALARGLMSRPKMLLLDEPSLGLAPIIAREFFETVSKLREEGLTVLLVEQNARAALQIADRGYVLETGRIVLEGTAQDLLGNPEVQRAYLGKGYEEVWQ